MKIYFRADASTAIGSGHVMRCLTLAAELRAAGCEILFLCCALPGNLAGLLRERDFAVALMPEGVEEFTWRQDLAAVRRLITDNGELPDWLIVDTYALDWRWETALRSYCKKIMVIDDLADRRHDCDVLLDQNYYPEMQTRYERLVPGKCRLLLGSRYALLRSEFSAAREKLPARGDSVKRLLISFGGSDPTGETLKTLQALGILQLTNVDIDVVVGASNPDREAVETACRQIPGCVFHCQVANMAEFMARADLAIGAGGSTSWERCYLGLPTMGVIVAANQEQLMAGLAEFGAIISLGQSRELTPVILAGQIHRTINDRQLRKEISRRCRELMSGYRAGAVSTVLMGDGDV